MTFSPWQVPSTQLPSNLQITGGSPAPLNATDRLACDERRSTNHQGAYSLNSGFVKIGQVRIRLGSGRAHLLPIQASYNPDRTSSPLTKKFLPISPWSANWRGRFAAFISNYRLALRASFIRVCEDLFGGFFSAFDDSFLVRAHDRQSGTTWKAVRAKTGCKFNRSY